MDKQSGLTREKANEQAQELADEAQATIRTLRIELAEAKAELKLMKQSTELADAAAEIKKLQDQLELQWAAVMMGKPVGPKTQFEKLKADAEIGRLVREMQAETKLRRMATFYLSYRYNREIHKWYEVAFVDDPAEALRAIQEAGDAEA